MLRRQVGASLVELMIGVSIGMASLSALSSLVGFGVGFNGKMLTHSRLNEEMKVVMSLMTRDLKRAGFTSDTLNIVTDPASTSSQFANSVSVSAYGGEAANSCITFAYDENQNGVLDTVGTNENFGYRLRDNAIEIRQSGALCTATGWEDLTDTSAVQITVLSFTTAVTTENNVTSTEITIGLQGALANDANTSRQYVETILVRNYD